MSERFVRLMCAALVALACLGFADEARADADAATLEGTLRGHLAAGTGSLGALADGGASFGHVLVVESLPRQGHVLVEFSVKANGSTLRFPAQLRRQDSVWTVSWLPQADYAEALLSMVRSGQLPPAETEPDWIEPARLPALPVIATRQRIVTPFGAIDPDANPEDAPAQGDLQILVELSRHTKRWVDEALIGDPAPAGFDLILDRRVSWKRLNELIFSVASIGLWQVSVVATSKQGQLRGVRVAAPVSTAAAGGPPPLAIAMYPRGDDFGFRVSHAGDILRSEASCDEKMSFCATGVQVYAGRLTAVLGERSEGVTKLMFASDRAVRVGDALPLVEASIARLDLEGHHVLVGYVQK